MPGLPPWHVLGRRGCVFMSVIILLLLAAVLLGTLGSLGAGWVCRRSLRPAAQPAARWRVPGNRPRLSGKRRCRTLRISLRLLSRKTRSMTSRLRCRRPACRRRRPPYPASGRRSNRCRRGRHYRPGRRPPRRASGIAPATFSSNSAIRRRSAAKSSSASGSGTPAVPDSP